MDISALTTGVGIFYIFKPDDNISGKMFLSSKVDCK